MRKLKYVYEYVKYLKNPFTALLFKFGLKKKCNIKFKNSNEEIDLTSIIALNKLMNILPKVKNNKLNELIKYIKDIDNDAEFVIIDNIKYYNIDNTHFKKYHECNYEICIDEYFSGDEWDMINFQDRFVIDIGVNIGDTALYFAKHGANVIGFEPVKHLYKLGIKNISANPNLKEYITLINKAVGEKE